MHFSNHSIMKFHSLFLLLLSLSLYSRVFSCDCGLDAFSQTRPEAIKDNWKYTKDVYTATVNDIYCKCFPKAEDNTKLRCVHITKHKEGDVLMASNENEIICTSSSPYSPSERGFDTLYYQSCDRVITKAKASATVSMAEVVPKAMDYSDKQYCGITTNMEEATKGSECSLTQQPCFYKLTVNKVYKGTKKEGDIIDSPGPDALTTCGDPRAQLTIGQTYMIGLGSICSLIQDWSLSSVFTEEDINLIKELSHDEGNSNNDKKEEEEETDNEKNDLEKEDEGWLNDKIKSEIEDGEDDKKSETDEKNNDDEEDKKTHENEETDKESMWTSQDDEDNDKMIENLNRDLNM